ncbi:MAG: hypothetical protein JXX29_12595 [Deltaproteobacteria bacterium]|nr:hypothetical protein [Deltaproteobacteria bacterium]MBN2672514.1 hypothetical protein [Deltaproteobacteria bacterium]
MEITIRILYTPYGILSFNPTVPKRRIPNDDPIDGMATETRILPIVPVLFLMLLFSSACLSFGKDEETTSPTPAQISRCVAEMYINPQIEIQPLGLKILGSGIDDAIWFKFETNAPVSDMFKPDVVESSLFRHRNNSFNNGKGIKWWDIPKAGISSDQIALPNARYMTVFIKNNGKRRIVYIFWNET